MGSPTLSTLSTAAAAELPAAAGASWVCGAPGAADSRASFEPEHEATHTHTHTQHGNLGGSGAPGAAMCAKKIGTDPTAEQSPFKRVWQG